MSQRAPAPAIFAASMWCTRDRPDRGTKSNTVVKPFALYGPSLVILRRICSPTRMWNICRLALAGEEIFQAYQRSPYWLSGAGALIGSRRLRASSFRTSLIPKAEQ